MFEQQLQSAGQSISHLLESKGLAHPEQVTWSPIPFKGQWGYGTAVLFQAAASKSRGGKKLNVAERAQELGAQIVEELHPPEGFERLEVERGYLNLYVDPSVYARSVVDTIFDQGTDYGRGPHQPDRVMVEYAQPNTHHSFHIGHARNVFLGEALARILEFAGYDTIRASYPGDIGLGVIQCLWCYMRFHAGQEPEGVHARGQWLAEVYAEAHRRLTPAEDETPDEAAQRTAFEAEVREIYHKWDEGEPEDSRPVAYDSPVEPG